MYKITPLQKVSKHNGGKAHTQNYAQTVLQKKEAYRKHKHTQHTYTPDVGLGGVAKSFDHLGRLVLGRAAPVRQQLAGRAHLNEKKIQ